MSNSFIVDERGLNGSSSNCSDLIKLIKAAYNYKSTRDILCRGNSQFQVYKNYSIYRIRELKNLSNIYGWFGKKGRCFKMESSNVCHSYAGFKDIGGNFILMQETTFYLFQ